MEVYAEIDSKTLNQIEETGKELVVPYGVQVYRKKGSRVCYFECDDEFKEDLIEFLNDNKISWQEQPEEWGKKEKEEKGRDKEEKKEPKRKGGFTEMRDSLNREE